MNYKNDADPAAAMDVNAEFQTFHSKQSFPRKVLIPKGDSFLRYASLSPVIGPIFSFLHNSERWCLFKASIYSMCQ